jgi:dihydropyrimidinase
MAKNADLIFKNGLIVTPSVVDGKIGAVGGDAFLPDAERVIDLAGKYLLPGGIDPECHLGGHRPLADDFQTETRAAAAAGVTTWGMQLVSLAITGGADRVKGPSDIPNFTKAMPIFYEAAKTAAIDFFLTPIVSTDEQVKEIPYLAEEHGISSFKLHLQMQGRRRQHLLGLSGSRQARRARDRAASLRELGDRPGAAETAHGRRPH